MSFLLIIILTLPSAASAENLFKRHDTVIPEQQMVENVAVVGGDVSIHGTVRDAVIVINGDLNIKKSAHIMGLILVIGGRIDQEPGSQVTDNVLNFTFDNQTANSFLIGGALLLGAWLLRIAFALILLVLPILTYLLMKDRLDSFVNIIRTTPVRTITVGLFTTLLLIAISILLSITVIGIPIVLILMLIILLFLLIGLTAVSKIAGESIPGSDRRPSWLVVVTGAIVVSAGINFPFFGGFILLGLVGISMGLMTIWFQEKRNRKKDIRKK